MKLNKNLGSQRASPKNSGAGRLANINMLFKKTLIKEEKTRMEKISQHNQDRRSWKLPLKGAKGNFLLTWIPLQEFIN